MSRDAGFPIADLDAGLLADPKVVALARRLKDPRQTAAHVALYAAVILESWASGERATLDAAAPAWWLDDLDDVLANLQAVGLLDSEGRVPEHAWDSWYMPAAERREASRDRWRRASAAARERAKGVIDDSARSHAPPTVPSVPFPTNRPSAATKPSRTGNDPTTCPRCGDEVRESDPDVAVIDQRGTLGHRAECPTIAAAPIAKAAHLRELYAVPEGA